MKIYLLIRSDFDGYNTEEAVDNYFRNKVDAEKEMHRLNETFQELDRHSDGWSRTHFWVEERDVL